MDDLKEYRVVFGVEITVAAKSEYAAATLGQAMLAHTHGVDAAKLPLVEVEDV